MPIPALVEFARALRTAGVAADAHRVQALLGAVDALGLDGVYWAGRLTLCAEPDDLPIYDAVFATHFTNRRPSKASRLPTQSSAAVTKRTEAWRAPGACVTARLSYRRSPESQPGSL